MAPCSSLQIRTKLLVDFIQDLGLQDTTLQDVINDVILTSLLNRATDGSMQGFLRVHQDAFSEAELLIYGASSRFRLKPSSKQRLLSELRCTLATVTDVFYGGSGTTQCEPHTGNQSKGSLPDTIVAFKENIETLRGEVWTTASHLKDMADSINQYHDVLHQGLRRAITTTFPAYSDARSADADLLAATIESSLIRLSLAHARSERAIYHHQPNQESRNIAQAISVSFSKLKKEEVAMKKEIDSLDCQLKEYEAMLQLVDGGDGGYRQIIDDWTKVRQETEECLRDLRRLGWTGD